ncbi:MAG TPA: hypothetical protein VJL90_02915 [Pseudorhodoplanes sp.]|nr:hypothetical protein [Pseudorhodoplanes sp.]
MNRIAFALLVNLCLCSFPSFANEAPLGLTWGATSEDVRAMGVELKESSGKDFGVSYTATSLPKAISDQDGALLSFGYDNRLWRILIFSRAFNDDPYGTAVKERYKQLQDVLAEKYGKAKSTHQLGESIYSEPRYFVSGISGGKSAWFTNFDNPLLFVQISIGASSGSTGFWRIIFEHKDGRRSFDAGKRQREKGAL